MPIRRIGCCPAPMPGPLPGSQRRGAWHHPQLHLYLLPGWSTENAWLSLRDRLAADAGSVVGELEQKGATR